MNDNATIVLVLVVAGFVIIGLTELFKKIGVNKRYAPVVALLVGVVLSLVPFFGGYMRLGESILAGAILGLIAAGTWDLLKKPIKQIVNK